MTEKAQGVDVSHHRGTIDWQQVKDSGIDFGIVKATDGAYFIDSEFDANWTGMRRAGLLRGAYHFYRPATDPHIQAAHYLSQVGDIFHASDLPPVLDCEAYPSPVREEFYAQPLDERLDRVRIWLETVRQATGRTPILYTNPATWQIVLGNDASFSAYPLWIAHYGVSAPTVPADNWGGHGWTFWQQTYEATVPGINNGAPPVDLNAYKSDVVALHTWAGWPGPRPLPPMVTNGEFFIVLRSAADTLQLDFEPWLASLDLAYLANQPGRPYDGPAVEEMNLPANHAIVIQEILEGGIVGDVQLLPANFTNQQIINAIYQAAGILEMAGWQLLTLAGLTDLVDIREALYTGALPDDLAGLDSTQRTTLNIELGLEEAPDDDPSDDPPPDEPSDPNEPYPDKTNQDIINAFYAAAQVFNLAGWSLLQQAQLTDLVQDRIAIYQGETIEALPGLTLPQQAAIAAALGVVRDGGLFDPPYPGLLNQDMVNIFYQAAQQHTENGWQWVVRAGLEDIATSQPIRYTEYRGPLIAEMTSLDVDERDTLAEALAANL